MAKAQGQSGARQNASAADGRPRQEQQRDRRTWIPWALIVVGMGVFTFSDGIRALVTPLETRAGFMAMLFQLEAIKGFALALFTAGIVTLSIERARLDAFIARLASETQRRMQELSDYVKMVTQRGPLPQNYYEHCQKQIMERKFLHYGWNMRFTIRPFAQDTSYLVFAFEQEYRVKNLHGTEEGYTIRHYEGREWDNKWPENPTRIRYVRARWDTAAAWLFQEGPIVAPDDEDPSYVRFEKKVTIPAEGVLFVQEASEKIMWGQATEAIQIEEPTLNVGAWVECPEALEVEFWAAHPKSKLGQTTTREDIGDGRVEFYWSFNEPMHPWMTIGVDWRPKPQPVAVAQAPAR